MTTKKLPASQKKRSKDVRDQTEIGRVTEAAETGRVIEMGVEGQETGHVTEAAEIGRVIGHVTEVAETGRVIGHVTEAVGTDHVTEAAETGRATGTGLGRKGKGEGTDRARGEEVTETEAATEAATGTLLQAIEADRCVLISSAVDASETTAGDA